MQTFITHFLKVGKSAGDTKTGGISLIPPVRAVCAARHKYAAQTRAGRATVNVARRSSIMHRCFMFMRFTVKVWLRVKARACAITARRFGGPSHVQVKRSQPKIVFSHLLQRQIKVLKVLCTYLLKVYFFDSGLSSLEGLPDNGALR